ncbi:MAG: polysaccharide deacetylase family protein [Oscillospiraceae bacterium]|nr:polysaccharide deacetylase family protein [Oscillospiraceae bacterium]
MIPERYRKAVTFSYDDGNMQDIRLIALFNQYHVKCTFNLNSGLNSSDTWLYKDMPVKRLNLPDCVDLYRNHEIAVHGKYHRNMTELDFDSLHDEIFSDRDRLTELFHQTPVGMAYPYGCYNQTVISMLQQAGIRYGRTVNANHSFQPQKNLLAFEPTCHHDDEDLFQLADQFLKSDSDEIQIFYIWGHSYEFDGNHNWNRIEKLLDQIAGKPDIFYGTNSEILL